MSIKSWICLLVITVLTVMYGSSVVSRAHIERDFAQYKAQVANSTLEAEQLARKVEQGMQEQVARIVKNEEGKRKALSDRVARTDAVNLGLRDEIARLNARTAPEDSIAAAYAGEARVARELLGACADEYRTVAKTADELRDQVSGLQDYAKVVESTAQ